MKSPLRYQITEFDCGSVSLVNCISYLFDREEIPTELIKVISTYTLDCYDEYGKLGNSSINHEIMYFISRWIKEFAIDKMIPLMCKYVRGEVVNFLMIKKVIMAGGTFIEGSTIELSADGPMRAPYVAYLQGGLSYAHVKICLEDMVAKL